MRLSAMIEFLKKQWLILWSCTLVLFLFVFIALFLLAVTSCANYKTTIGACYSDEYGHNACLSTQFEPIQRAK